MKCYGYPGSGGVCVMRMGKVLSEDDCNHIHEIPDKEVCKFKEGMNCMCAAQSGRNPVEVEVNINSNDEIKIKVKDENEPLKDKDIFDAFFGD